jgi:hypothetical protein
VGFDSRSDDNGEFILDSGFFFSGDFCFLDTGVLVEAGDESIFAGVSRPAREAIIVFATGCTVQNGYRRTWCNHRL